MATYFVRKTGLDTNAGTSASLAFLTIGKALSVVAAADTAYVGAGIYRETVTLTTSGTTGNLISLIADTDGSHTGDAGEIIWTAYTSSDTTTPATASVINVNGKSFYALTGFTLVCGAGTNTFNPSAVDGDTVHGATNWTVTRCTFLASGAIAVGTLPQNLIRWVNTAGQAVNLTIDSCLFFNGGGSSSIPLIFAGSGSADYNVNVVIRNCLFVGGPNVATDGVILLTRSDAVAGKPGGVNVYNCTIVGAAYGFNINGSATFSTTIPCGIFDSVIHASVIGIGGANSAGEIVEDYNIIMAPTARSNVTAGTHSKSDGSLAPLLELGQAGLRGANIRPFLQPMHGSPLLGFGNQTGGPTLDALGYNRPAGGASALRGIGYLERNNTWSKESVVLHGASGLSITGPGVQDFQLPVDATATTISIYMQYDSNYVGTLPQFTLTGGGECGVADQTATLTGAANTWTQTSIGPFIPTKQGIVTVRIQSNDTSGAGRAYAGTFAVA